MHPHEIPAAGSDPDTIEAAAKHQLAAADDTHDERARADVERAAKGRALMAERNDCADPKRVAAIDKEYAELGFGVLPASTIAQRGEQRAPLGRHAAEKDTAAAPKGEKAAADDKADDAPKGTSRRPASKD